MHGRAYTHHRMLAEKIATHDETPVDDHIVVLRDATWSDYQRLLELRGERAVPRLAYLEGALELIVPSQEHEEIKSTIGYLVAVWCLERDVTFRAFGSWTLGSQATKRGAEPDECYVFSDDVRKPQRPDLAVEVIWTSGRIDKLDIYRTLGVREVWIWRRGRLTAYTLVGDGYEEIPSSQVLPGIDLVELASFIDRPSASQAMKDYRAALQARK